MRAKCKYWYVPCPVHCKIMRPTYLNHTMNLANSVFYLFLQDCVNTYTDKHANTDIHIGLPILEQNQETTSMAGWVKKSTSHVCEEYIDSECTLHAH